MGQQRKQRQVANSQRIKILEAALSDLQFAFNGLLQTLAERDTQLNQYLSVHLSAIPASLAEVFPEKYLKDDVPVNIYQQHIDRIEKFKATKKAEEDATRKELTVAPGEAVTLSFVE